MFITKKAMPRRTMLRGAGAALALPLLDAMVPAMTATAASPAAAHRLRRLGFVYMPMGCDQSRWRVDGETLDTLSPILRPLENVKHQVCVLSGLELKNAYPGTHATSNAAFLSAAKAKRTESNDYYLGTTVDQIAAQAIGRDTPLPSLELAMDLLSVVGQCDNGYACVYQNNLSWASPTTPLPAEAHPRIVFETLFGDGGSKEERLQALRRRASLLDAITDEWRRLNRDLGPADRQRVNDYLDAVREVERRISQAEQAATENPMPDMDRPVGVPADYGEHARLMFDLQVLALQGDITRVITFQLARETSNRTYPQVGVSEPHHPLTHHGNDPEKIAKVAKINEYHVSLFAYFLERLQGTPEGEGTLLDHALLLYGSGMGNPNVHDHRNLPILVAGGAAGQIRGGRHIAFDQPTPLANLHLSLLHKVGVPIEQFGDSTGQLDELIAPVSI
ncbi:MAG: hypothetical protein KatS3mg111_0178 [Pirellulaceae bacterium]|nr:MAG: hypothetical protein KatS3mg111_0178 [Pirellulaceae bacterium]